MTTTADTLRAARARIEDPANWWDGHTHRQPRARRTECAFVALYDLRDGDCNEALAILDKTAGGSVVTYNDSHTHAEVLDLFTRAIEAAERGEA